MPRCTEGRARSAGALRSGGLISVDDDFRRTSYDDHDLAAHNTLVPHLTSKRNNSRKPRRVSSETS